ncbi:MAG TPA: hypothetical protein PKY82_32060 [Pyrinomonadaceae bacterium]|nr:hypothetical protein [Pyrinomonadaceae bacterium]
MAKNKGQLYEPYINKILEDKGFFPLQLKGNLEGHDSAFKHKGIIYYLELKNNVAPDFGQKGLKWNRRDGWIWSTEDDVTKMYDDFKVRERIPSNFTPNLFTVPLGEFKNSHQVLDKRAFEQVIPLDQKQALHRFYANKKVFYIQVEGRGFYYLEQDVAKLQVPQFDPDLTLRLRAKQRSSKSPNDYAFWAVIRVKSRSIRPTTFDIEEENGKNFPPFEKR